MERQGIQVQKLPLGVSWGWLKTGIKLVHQNFFTAFGATFIAVVLNVLVAQIPFVGVVLGSLLSTVLIAGYIEMVEKWEKGEKAKIGNLFVLFDEFDRLKKGLGSLSVMAGFAISTLAVMMVWVSIGLKLDPNTFISQFQFLEPQVLALVALTVLWYVFAMLVGWWATVSFFLQIKYSISTRSAFELVMSNTWKNFLAYLVWVLVGIVAMVGSILTLFIGFLWVIPVFQFSYYFVVRDGFKRI